MHLRIEGRVQGVCYRMCARDEAIKLGLCGWVRNLSDGSVEALAEGDETALARFMDWCRKGPAYGRVTNLHSQFSEYQGAMDDFSIRPG